MFNVVFWVKRNSKFLNSGFDTSALLPIAIGIVQYRQAQCRKLSAGKLNNLFKIKKS
jgi:hypothetical protein